MLAKELNVGYTDGSRLIPLLNNSTGYSDVVDGAGVETGVDVDVMELLLLDVGDMDGRFDNVPKRLV